jgi:nucleoid DNA-binding protein
MNKAELISEIQKELGGQTSKAEAERSLNAVLKSLKVGLKKSKKNVVQLIRFGTFRVVTRKARNGINPQTGKTIKIAASKTIRFKPSPDLIKGV